MYESYPRFSDADACREVTGSALTVLNNDKIKDFSCLSSLVRMNMAWQQEFKNYFPQFSLGY